MPDGLNIQKITSETIQLRPNIYMLNYVSEELHNIICKASKENQQKFRAKFDDRLNYLSNNLGREFMHKEWFERLENDQCGLSAIRFNHFKAGNIRILYYESGGIAFLLLAFIEHNKKDYTNHQPSAHQRLRAFLK